MLFGLKPDITEEVYDRTEIRRTANRSIKIATAVTTAIQAAAQYVRAHPWVVAEWTVQDLRDCHGLDKDECAELHAIIRDPVLLWRRRCGRPRRLATARAAT
jgi:hypothetical protein